MPPLRTRRSSPTPRRIASSLLALLTLLAAPTLASQTAPRARTVAERLGHPADAKLLILHADDLGVAHSVNAASLDALERGVISSASVMMPTPWVTEVAAWARAHPDHDLGLHLTLTSEWQTYRWGTVAPATQVPSLLDSTGTLPSATRVVTARAAVADVERELRAQIERARALGLHPTHLDSHMFSLYSSPALYATLARVAHAYNLPYMLMRGADGTLPPGVEPGRDVVLDTVIVASEQVPREGWKAFYVDAVRRLKPGLSQILVHLGRDDAELRAVTVGFEAYGSAWRGRDDEVLRSPEFRQALRDNNVVLVRWKDLQALARRP